MQRSDRPGIHGFIARHDGYAQRFGLHHERELSLAAGGNILEGCDRILRSGTTPVKNDGRDLITVRFHIHPDVQLFRDQKERLVLTGPDIDTWVFISPDVAAEVEESIYFAGLGGPRRSRQIVLAFKASEISEVHWQFSRTRIIGRIDNDRL